MCAHMRGTVGPCRRANLDAKEVGRGIGRPEVQAVSARPALKCRPSRIFFRL
ncbi:hypothetical protein PRUPE_2G057900 [Prunus persica]|uniref:Uncharacterized protein n=1 Tax=Prunus persica TaxID=3760 RepID=A0A251QBW9_PRUPE|nr:hypothetical protein PRUPE_2G057900 [Prunus persica]